MFGILHSEHIFNPEPEDLLEGLRNHDPSLNFKNLLLKPYRCRYFSDVFVLFFVAVAVSTHLCVICGHFCSPISIGSLRDDGNENGKTSIGLDQQNNNFARASRFFVHFFADVARLQLSRLVEDGNTRKQLSFSCPEL